VAPLNPDLPDTEVVALAQAGDHEAFRILVEKYQGRAYRLAVRILKDEDLAKDAVQDGFLKAYGSLAKFEGRSGFYTWLYRLIFNLCIDMKRRDRSGRHVEWDETVARDIANVPGAAIPHTDAGPGRALERSQLRVALAEAIETLPEDARRTLVLREVDGLSYTEIAESLGVAKGTVMSRLHHARRRVREALVEKGVVEHRPQDVGETA
jgi:RNA polymerase sigma-70 factor (ECF subfamily)